MYSVVYPVNQRPKLNQLSATGSSLSVFVSIRLTIKPTDRTLFAPARARIVTASQRRGPAIRSTAQARRSTVGSAQRAAMICRPTGNPDPSNPDPIGTGSIGTDAAGSPARLAGSGQGTPGVEGFRHRLPVDRSGDSRPTCERGDRHGGGQQHVEVAKNRAQLSV